LKQRSNPLLSVINFPGISAGAGILELYSGIETMTFPFNLELETPYSEALNGILAFSTLPEAEETIRKLDILCRKYEISSDKKGVDYCRRIAAQGRRRSELIYRNKRVALNKRLQKKEMAVWFGIWLETPDIFFDWIVMRKETEDFKKLLVNDSQTRSKLGERHAPRGKSS